MSFIPENKLEEIKDSADIVEIVSETVLLKKAGNNYVGLCPFHAEKTPSFTVSPEKQIFHCFGCSVGGNVFNFLMQQEGLTFPEAAKSLARRYGIKIYSQKLSQEQKKEISEKEALFAVNNHAKDYFRRCLNETRAGKNAMAYLTGRGISRKIIDDFSLGYAPDGWSNVLNFLLKKNISAKMIEIAGLIVPREGKNGYYDRFRNRVIFPIFNIRRQVTGFGARVMDNSLPKYINSPESPIYSKKKSLYAVDLAKQKARASETVFIAEGYLDALALHQNGFENSVATLGTSLTSGHIQILKGFVGKSGRAILVYDSDAAGIKAAKRSIEIFDKGYLDARILVLPSRHDPDSFLLKYGKQAFVKLVDKAQGAISFLIESSIRKHGLSTEGKIRIISDIKEQLSAIQDNVARSLYIKELAERIRVDESLVMEKIRINQNNSQGLKRPPESGESLIERRIITMMLQFPEILPEIANLNVLDYFDKSRLKSIGETLLRYSGDSGVDVSQLINIISDDETIRIVGSLAIKEEPWNLEGGIKLIQKFVQTMQARRENKPIEEQIREAEKINDEKLLLKLLGEKQKLAVLSEKRKMALASLRVNKN